jgi:ribosomal protein L21E
MTAFKEGDRVQIADRDATADDAKTGLFYNHFRGLTGTVQKIYGEEAAIEIETQSLTETVASRHEDVREQMKTKWLDGLSEDAKSRLTDAEKDFQLRYTVLVAIKDLGKPSNAPLPPRKTSADLEAAEDAEIQKRLTNSSR